MIFPEGTTTDGTALIRFEYFFPFFKFSSFSIFFKSTVLPQSWCLHPWETSPAGMMIFLLNLFLLFLKVGISYEGASHVIWTEGSSSLLWVGRYIPEEDVDYNDDGDQVTAYTLATLHTPITATFLPVMQPSPRTR